MVRFEKQGDSFVLVTGSSHKQDISILITALSELQNPSPDISRIQEGLAYLDNCGGADFRKEVRTVLQKAVDNKGMTIVDL